MAEINVAEHIEQIEKNIMSGLKDFQRATVNRIEGLFRAGQMRVLVSDEVGLGKTLIARGTVAKLAKMQKEQGDNLVKVVYICSNASIAEQNLNKLRISSELRAESTGASRLSMQHIKIFRQENDEELLSRFIQLIPLTPDTSFRMTTGAGTVDERALMFAILKRVPSLSKYEKALEVAMKDWASSAWDAWAKAWYERQVVEVDEQSDGRYLSYMVKKVTEELNVNVEKNVTVQDLVVSMCNLIEKNNYKRQNNNYVIGKLRVLFAKISLDKLEPDLVIMDEFQRFKYLINSDPETETGMLANKFFNSHRVRMLLLSATPYKMYSTLEEIDENQVDEHYSEFFDVMNFLNISKEEQDSFKGVWSDYSVKLKELSKGDTTVISAKRAAEDAMYQHICRTERISAYENADIINDEDVHVPLSVMEQDIKSYLQAQKLLEDIGAPFNVPVDYVKSTPYLMSFMRDYQLKRYIEKYFSEHPDEINKINRDTFWLKRNSLDRYDKIPNGNARLDRVMEHTFKDNAELLLWVPPSRPYYTPQGVYKNANAFSKTLVFSSWEMVPRMIASLLSYEAERKTVGKLAKANEDKEAHYFYTGERRYPSARMNFSVSNGTPNAMTLFCLMYPSQFLTKCYDPVDCMNRGLSLREIEKEVKGKIAEKLAKYETTTSGRADNSWYYVAPLLLDGAGYVTGWLGNDEALASFDDEDEKARRQKGFLTHLKSLKELYYATNYGKTCNLGKKPDDLLEVLTDMAIASPAITINRTYQNYCKKGLSFPSYLPSQIAKIFINRMNTAESTATVELACGKKSDDAHWQNLLTYCKHGNIQAMFDEYAHVIANGLDADNNLVSNLHYMIASSMDVRTTIYTVDTYNGFKARVNGNKARGTAIRSHFAVAFTKGDGKEKDADRKKSVRNSFNSPFRPFVLASTSIGQEGLDFHNYCRRIVHWNLPSNPIDLEQREGRINRFECLAIRQNIAKRYGNINFTKDIWKEMFCEAQKTENNGEGSDLIPFWGLTEQEDMIKIERIVPMYPFSRDGLAYERLIKILSLYRLTLGQARQEELIEYLFKNCEDMDDIRELFINLSPYYKSEE
ncbi:MAG: DEAD/DEAH box helicase family protein [Lachnospiraceae bacterium]|nr:DEAD/DEAH box helicase family protein [Lachnospiraceae bacterium]